MTVLVADPVADLASVHRRVREQVVAAEPSARLYVRSVRAKPGRGLVVGYSADDGRGGGRPLTARCGALPGAVELRWFPDDAALPALAEVLSLSPRVLDALRESACAPAREEVTAVRVVRYKPGDRCVVRFDLGDTAVFAKVVHDPAAALEADRLQRLLWDAGAGVARPGAVVADLGLTLTEGVVDGVRPGLEALRPGRSGPLPVDALAATGRLLAQVHATPATLVGRRDDDADLRRLRERASALQGWSGVPLAELADRLADRLAGRLAHRLGTGAPAVLTHGAFKPSQLLVGPQRCVVVDLDGVAAGDPARDLGYLRAYLRQLAPVRGGGERLGQAVDLAMQAYLEGLDALDGRRSRASSSGDPAELAAGARLHEAATLFKIVHRRVNRLQSPRPREVRALAARVDHLLSSAAGRRR